MLPYTPGVSADVLKARPSANIVSKNMPICRLNLDLKFLNVLTVIILRYNKFLVSFTLCLSDADQDKTISFI